MSELETGKGGSLGFDGGLWKNQSWANLSNSTENFLVNSNSENSSGNGNEGEEIVGEKEKELIEAKDQEQPESSAPVKKTLAAKKIGGGKKINGKGTKGKGKGKGSSDEAVKAGKEGSGDSEDDHELHIYTERERRKKMRNMFSNLHALLPQLPSKADKSTIVDEAVSYIKRLELNLQSLEQQKRDQIRNLTGNNVVNYNSPSLLLNPQNAAYDSRDLFLNTHASSSNLVTTSTTANGFNISLNYPLTNALSNSSYSIQPIGFDTWTSSNSVLSVCGNEAHISVCTPKKTGIFTQICYVLEKYKLVVVSAHINSDSHRNIYMIQAEASRAPDNQFLDMFSAEDIFKQAVAEINLWVAAC